MKKIEFRKNPNDVNLDTQKILISLLTMNGPEGKTITDMQEAIDLLEKVKEATFAEGLILTDSEYDRIKTIYEKNRWPINDKFFLEVWKDIKDYTSLPDPKKAVDKSKKD